MNHAHDRLKAACVTVLGSGCLRPAPGTWASLLAAILFALLWTLGGLVHAPRLALDGVLLSGVVLASRLTVSWGRWAMAHYQCKDPCEVTLDEFAGQWVALLFVPLGLMASAWSLACVFGGQFLLFRFFDILKPPPARQLEALPAGWGILLDDLFAGLYANVVGQVLWRLTPLAGWLGVTLSR